MAGKLFIFSAPSGSGKTTIVKHLMDKYSHLGFSVSATTRPIREGKETDGKDYYFFSKEDFEEKLEKEGFVEWEEVYHGYYYGTLKAEIERLWSEGKDVVFDVDVIGGINLKNYYKEKALAIFVKAPSFEEIIDRLRNRGTESKESLETRIGKVKDELTYEKYFDVTLVNDKLDEAKTQAEKLITEFK